jgi:muconolactone delta-isomerase
VEYLVTMTTHVPEGTPAEAVDDVRAKEAAHSRELAAQGHLLRLWRPPLRPGEWRTLGLFAAAGDRELEEVLASMPLRVWRTDEVTPLMPHPNDPAVSRGGDPAEHHPYPPELAPPSGSRPPEFLTTFHVEFPDGTPAADAGDARAREAVRARELAAQGHLLRLWALPGPDRALGLWQASDAGEMQAIVDALPLTPWMTTQVTPLSEHPSDPAAVSRGDDPAEHHPYPPASAG